ncbi:hypothetical protein CDCA_CDCA08G2289 [Cyanidium caldarium]|uniref:Archease domain-containing protein n=1 Tax=Cyanidium caldarium TaxID=2771 RepID=A0AAV9IVF0_CYACA|nr:hypothetical protein CDCA_CDCA08G2289 [Cyanidium caldarium]
MSEWRYASLPRREPPQKPNDRAGDDRSRGGSGHNWTPEKSSLRPRATEPEGRDATPAPPARALDARDGSHVVADAATRPRCWEYLDHTADVMVHAWSATLAGAMAACLLGVYGILTDVDKVECAADATVEWRAHGHDAASLLYNFLDEGLYRFHTDGWVGCRVQVLQLEASGTTTAEDAWRIAVRVHGEPFSLQKHEQGTEVKAITYSAMQILRDGVSVVDQSADVHAVGRYDVYVIVDI